MNYYRIKDPDKRLTDRGTHNVVFSVADALVVECCCSVDLHNRRGECSETISATNLAARLVVVTEVTVLSGFRSNSMLQSKQ